MFASTEPVGVVPSIFQNMLRGFSKPLLLFLQELTRDSDGKLEINLKYPHYFPIMERCKVWQRDSDGQYRLVTLDSYLSSYKKCNDPTTLMWEWHIFVSRCFFSGTTTLAPFLFVTVSKFLSSFCRWGAQGKR